MAIPSDRNEFDPDREKRLRQQQTDFNHTIDQADEEGDTLRSGRLKLSHRGNEESLAIRKKKERDRKDIRFAMKQAMMALDQHIIGLEKRIGEIQERKSVLEIEIEELQDMKDKAAKGEFDPNDPENQRLMKKYGITKEDIDSGMFLTILAGKINERQGEWRELDREEQDKTIELERAKEFKEEFSRDPYNPVAIAKAQNFEATREDRRVSDSAFTMMDQSQKRTMNEAIGFNDQEMAILGDINDPHAFFGTAPIAGKFNAKAEGEELPVQTLETEVAAKTALPTFSNG